MTSASSQLPMRKMRGKPADTDDSLDDGVWTPARAVPPIAITYWPAWPEIPRYSHSILRYSTPDNELMHFALLGDELMQMY